MTEVSLSTLHGTLHVSQIVIFFLAISGVLRGGSIWGLFGLQAHQNAVLMPEGVGPWRQGVRLAKMMALPEVPRRLQALEGHAMQAELRRHLAGADPRAC